MTARRTPKTLLALITTLFVIFVVYFLLEIVARVSVKVDPSIAHRVQSAQNPQAELKGLIEYSRLGYGWDRPPVFWSNGTPADSVDNADVLVLGDSVTWGFGVEQPERRSYPALLSEAFANEPELTFVNGAVPGFGIDQMTLKLGGVLRDWKPRLVLVAYIPADLRRSGRDLNFGLTKPVLFDYADRAWDMRPAPNVIRLYEDYLAARSQMHLGIWWLQFLMTNRQYYLPAYYESAYILRFDGVRRNLQDLAKQYGFTVLLIRIPNGNLGRTVSMLDLWAKTVFSGNVTSSYRFLDIEPCVRTLARRSGLDFDRDFSGHPDGRAHQVYASCLKPAVAEELGME